MVKTFRRGSRGPRSMHPTTRAQREACFALFQRHAERIAYEMTPNTGYHCKSTIQRYAAFRQLFFNNGQWLGGYTNDACTGIYYGIEPDGHTHT